MQSPAGVPRPALIVAITLGVLLAVGVAVIGIIGQQSKNAEREAQEAAERARREGPLALPPVPAPKATSQECAAVMGALPRELLIDGQRVPRRDLAEPVPPASIAWGDANHDPVTVRCGIVAPAELTPTSRLIDISGVEWLRITEAGDTSWLAVDRPVFVALTQPTNSGSGPVQDISRILRDTLPKRDPFP